MIPINRMVGFIALIIAICVWGAGAARAESYSIAVLQGLDKVTARI